MLRDPQHAWPHAVVSTQMPGNHSVRTEDWRAVRRDETALAVAPQAVPANESGAVLETPDVVASIGRDLRKLAAISRASGVPIVCPTGLPLETYYPPGHWGGAYGEEEITRLFVAGNLALRSGKKLAWDGPNFRVTNDDAATRLLHRDYRAGWTL